MADFGYGLGQTLGGINDWWKTLRNPSAPESPAARYLPRQDYIGREIDPVGDAADEFGRSFGAGFSGAPDPAIEGQRQALRNMGQPPAPATPPPVPPPQASSGFNADEAAAALRRGMERRSLSEAMFGHTEGPHDLPAFDPAPPPPDDSHVSATINGKTYEYGGGQAGGAPTLGGIGNKFGEQWSNVISDQTLEHSQPGIGHGSFSQMTANPEMASLGQLQDDRALEDARPTGDPLGYTRGDMRGLDTGIRTRMADEMGRGQSAIALAHEKAAIEQADEQRVMNNLAPLEANDNAEIEEMKSDPRFRSASPEQQAEFLTKLKLKQDDRNAQARRYKENLALARGKVSTSFAPNAPGGYVP